MPSVRHFVNNNKQLFLCYGDHDTVRGYVRVKINPHQYSRGYLWLKTNINYDDWALLNMQIWFTNQEDATAFSLICN